MTASGTPRRVALIGLSGYGRIHLQLARACRDRGEVVITAAAVINPEQEAENVAELRAHGTEIFADYRTMLQAHAGRIDLCFIPTGIHWHARMTVAALAAGANVLVEKPLAATVAEADAVRTAERASGRFVAVGFQDCYDPGTLWLAEQLRQGAIGDVRSVRFLGVWPRARTYFQRNDWAGRIRVGEATVNDSPLNNAFGHFVMLSLLFAGVTEADIVRGPVQAELFRTHAIESFDTGVVTLETARGTRLWFGASHASRTAIEPEILLEGSAGHACWRYEQEARLTDAAGHTERRVVLDQHATRREMMAAVLRRLDDPAAGYCTTAMAACHTRLIETIHRGHTVATVPPDRVTWDGPNGADSAVPLVRGLDAALRAAFAGQRRLADAGFAPLAPVPTA